MARPQVAVRAGVIHSHIPAPALRRFVRYYYQVEDALDGAIEMQPVPARSPEIIEFMLATPYTVQRKGQATSEGVKAVALVGNKTHRLVNLFMSGRVDAFTIAFQPGGLTALFGVPSHLLTDRDFDASDVVGPGISSLREHLGDVSSIAARAQVADEFLLARCPDFRRGNPIMKAARMVHMCRGSVRIVELGDRTGLGMRQFERRFVREIGIAPKLYSRIVRFEAALRMKAARPGARWTEVAHALGYHDQMHMVHDFNRLSGDTPTRIIDRLDMFVKPEIEVRGQQILPNTLAARSATGN